MEERLVSPQKQPEDEQGLNAPINLRPNSLADFVGQKQHEKLYVQVCYLLASEETIQREFGVYASVPDNFPKYVVSMDELDMSRDGIKHRNIRDFLTQPEWN